MSRLLTYVNFLKCPLENISYVIIFYNNTGIYFYCPERYVP